VNRAAVPPHWAALAAALGGGGGGGEHFPQGRGRALIKEEVLAASSARSTVTGAGAEEGASPGLFLAVLLYSFSFHCAVAVREAVQVDAYLRYSTSMATLQEVENKLRTHDWYYHYSDDYSVFLRGKRQWDDLVAACKEVKVDDLRPLWEKHAPKDFQDTFDHLFNKENAK
jgi:hypothetical protein